MRGKHGTKRLILKIVPVVLVAALFIGFVLASTSKYLAETVNLITSTTADAELLESHGFNMQVGADVNLTESVGLYTSTNPSNSSPVPTPSPSPTPPPPTPTPTATPEPTPTVTSTPTSTPFPTSSPTPQPSPTTITVTGESHQLYFNSEAQTVNTQSGYLLSESYSNTAASVSTAVTGGVETESNTTYAYTDFNIGFPDGTGYNLIEDWQRLRFDFSELEFSEPTSPTALVIMNSSSAADYTAISLAWDTDDWMLQIAVVVDGAPEYTEMVEIASLPSNATVILNGQLISVYVDDVLYADGVDIGSTPYSTLVTSGDDEDLWDSGEVTLTTTFDAAGVSPQIGYRAYLLHTTGTTTELTSGTPEGAFTLAAGMNSYITTTITVATETVILGYDALEIDIYIYSAGEWVNRAKYLSGVLITKQLSAATWTMTLYVVCDGSTATFHFGNTDYHSGVDGVTWTTPNQSDIELWRINRGDLVGFIIGPYIDTIGGAFHIILLIGVVGVLYFKYRNFGVIAFLVTLFGGASGLLWILIPPDFAVAGIAFSAIVIVGTATIIWRLIR